MKLHSTPIVTGTTDIDAELEVYPHYTDKRFKNSRTVFCSEPDALEQSVYNTWRLPDCCYDYSDRLWEEYRDKAQKAGKKADESGATRRTARWYQAYLSHIFGQPVVVKHILAGYRGDGYPYQVFGTCNSQKTN